MAHEDRGGSVLALGHPATVGAVLEALTSAHPLRERLWALRALALTPVGPAGRGPSGVERGCAPCSTTSSGAEPGVELRDLQTAILRQDPPALAWTAPPEEPTTPVVVAQARPDREAHILGPAPWPLAGRDAGSGSPGRSARHRREQVPLPTPCSPVSRACGKSRLAAELLAVAREEREAAVAVGRCSQDEGAPPLWA